MYLTEFVVRFLTFSSSSLLPGAHRQDSPGSLWGSGGGRSYSGTHGYTPGRYVYCFVCLHASIETHLVKRKGRQKYPRVITHDRLGFFTRGTAFYKTSEAITNNLFVLSPVKERDKKKNWITSLQPSQHLPPFTMTDGDVFMTAYHISLARQLNASSPFCVTQRTRGTTRGLSPCRTSSTVPWNQMGTASGGSQVGQSELSIDTTAWRGACAADALWSVTGLLIHWDLFHNAIVCAITRGWEVCIPVL